MKMSWEDILFWGGEWMGIRERKIGQEKSMFDGVLHLQVCGRSREEGSANLIPEVAILERTKKSLQCLHSPQKKLTLKEVGNAAELALERYWSLNEALVTAPLSSEPLFANFCPHSNHSL